jgi:hypothetical protein
LRRTSSLHHIRRHGFSSWFRRFKGGRRRLVRPARPQHWPPSRHVCPAGVFSTFLSFTIYLFTSDMMID